MPLVNLVGYRVESIWRGKANELAQLIAQHPDQFLELLAEDNDGDTPLPAATQSISVTEEEREAIERVCLLLSNIHEII